MNCWSGKKINTLYICYDRTAVCKVRNDFILAKAPFAMQDLVVGEINNWHYMVQGLLRIQ
jgi:hypothetical protein